MVPPGPRSAFFAPDDDAQPDKNVIKTVLETRTVEENGFTMRR